MKVTKLILAGILTSTLFSTAVFADYNKGFKYYKKFIKKKTKLKGTEFIKLLDVKTPDELNKLFENNAKGLIVLLEKKGHKDAAKAVKKLVKKGKAKDLKDFLLGLMNGKIPAGC